jgi:competence protein ComGF
MNTNNNYWTMKNGIKVYQTSKPKLSYKDMAEDIDYHTNKTTKLDKDGISYGYENMIYEKSRGLK